MWKATLRSAPLAIALALLCSGSGSAQPATGDKPPPEMWHLYKSKGGVYSPPMRPLWKLSDLKKMHAGQTNWQQQIIKDSRQEATYNSAAPGTKFVARIHPDTPTVFAVVAGEVHFAVEGQQPVTATRGSVVNIMRDTIYSYDVEGAENALWVEIDPADYKAVYPADVSIPPAGRGQKVVTVTFNGGIHVPGEYVAPNQLHFNTLDLVAHCKVIPGSAFIDDHITADIGVAYANPADNKCSAGKQNAAAPAPVAEPPFNPHSTFGHLHVGWAEWWIVEQGAVRGRFENAGDFIAHEGDVLYAPPSTWHETAPEAPSGPSVRLTISAYPEFNMYTTKDNTPGP